MNNKNSSVNLRYRYQYRIRSIKKKQTNEHTYKYFLHKKSKLQRYLLVRNYKFEKGVGTTTVPYSGPKLLQF